MIRWFLITAGFGFVLWGWYQSGQKYLSAKSSISITLKEIKQFRYPSVTICPGFKDRGDLVTELKKSGKDSLDQVDLEGIIDRLR